MKTKKIRNKLTLNKSTISDLNGKGMSNINGGATYTGCYTACPTCQTCLCTTLDKVCNTCAYTCEGLNTCDDPCTTTA